MSSINTIPDKGLVVVDSDKRNISLSFSKATFVLKKSGQRRIECTLDQVLWVEITEDNTFRLSLLHRRKSGLALLNLTATFDPILHDTAVDWAESLMDVAYEGRSRSRKFQVIINPHGGRGKALTIFERKVKPIFEAANCIMDVMVTKYYKHCYEYSKTMGLDYDAIVLLSGDGLVHEVFNAFAERDDSVDAFDIPVVQIPTGSANALSLCLLGLKNGHDVCSAALNAIKGQPMKLDLCSVEQDGKRVISFMSQAVGMMADADLGTEHLRWMGDTRFMIGLLREIGANRQCPVKLEIKVASQDKQGMVQAYRASRTYRDVCVSRLEDGSRHHTETAHSPQPLQELNFLGKSLPLDYPEDRDQWTVIDKPLTYIYAGKLPYVSRDFMQFPLALSDDGFLDIVAQEHCSRTLLLKGISGAAQGKQYWAPTQHYFKAKAYRITPLSKKGSLSLDGEKYPYLPFQVDIHPRRGTTLGDGGWHTPGIPSMTS